MKKTTTFCLTLFTLICQSQSFEWFKTPPVSFDANGSLLGYPNTVDPFDNIYVSGYQDNRFLYSDVFGHMLLNKYAPDGTLLFSKTIEGHAQIYNIKSDAQGNILILAGYVNIITVGNLTLNTVEQGVQPLLLKFDADGNLLWHLPLDTIDPFIDHAEAMVIDTVSNHCYVAFDNFNSSYIQKISPEGVVLNTITQTHAHRITSLSLDTEHNIYAAGACVAANATFAGISAATELQYNTYVAKYNPDGAFEWVRFIEDITCSTPMVVARTPDEIYFCSPLFGAFTFGSFTTEGPESMAFGDFFLTKLNANGEFQWVREVPGDGFGEMNLGNRNFLALDTMGKIYISGSTSRTIDWGNGIVSNISGNSGDAAVLRYDSDGNIEQIITGGGAWEDRVDGISIDSHGSIYASGMGYGATNFGPFAHTGSFYFPYLTKISSTLSTNTNSKNQSLWYPNPAKDLLYFRNINATKGIVYNMLGQSVMQFSIQRDVPVSVSALPSGTYILAVDGYKTQQLIKE